MEECGAGSAAIRLDNLLLAQPQWLTSSLLQMTSGNVNPRVGGRADVGTWPGAHRHERLCWFEAEVAISSLEVRANDQTQPNCVLSLSPSAKSRRGEARDRASDLGLVLGPKRLILQNVRIALETTTHFRELCVGHIAAVEERGGSHLRTVI